MRFLLKVAYDILMVPSRASPSLISVCRCVVQGVLTLMALQVDLSQKEPWWAANSALALRPSPKKRRTERVSWAFKEVVASSVSSDRSMGSVRGFLACQHTMHKVDATSSGDGYDSSNSSRITREPMVQYSIACQELHKDIDRLHLSLDGCRVGGEETVPMIAYSPTLHKMSYAPPQALSVGSGSNLFLFRKQRHGNPRLREAECNGNPRLISDTSWGPLS